MCMLMEAISCQLRSSIRNIAYFGWSRFQQNPLTSSQTFQQYLLLEVRFKHKGLSEPQSGKKKMSEMLVISLRGVNHGFCSNLGCSKRNVIIFSQQGI